MRQLAALPGNTIAAVCDVYEPRLLRGAELAGPGTARHLDYRRILDDREIDAVLIGTPDHWHRAMTLDAVAAGKDVYVEKPVSHSIEEGAEMVRVIEASKQVVQTGTQQRSWDHWVLAKQIIDSGKLGQITLVHAYWYQHVRAIKLADVDLAKLDWKRWLGSAPDQPFVPERFYRWRFFWDFGGGTLTDLLTHWIDVVHWYLGVEAPLTAVATGKNYSLKMWEAPDTVTATFEFPKDFIVTYTGTYVSRIDDGGLEFRGDRATLKIDRARLVVYNDESRPVPGTNTPEPEIHVRSMGDGTVAHLENWLAAIRSRQAPSAPIRAAHHAARTAHIANAALKAGRKVEWSEREQKVVL
jgi:predicted dehydrogenase